MPVLRTLAHRNPNPPSFLCNTYRLFNAQNTEPYEPTATHYDNLINAAARNGDFAAIRNLLNKRVRDGCFNTKRTFDFITNTDAGISVLDELSQTLAHLDQGFPRKSAYDSLIARLCKINRVDDSLRLVKTMIQSNYGVNASTFHPILNALTRKKKNTEEARRVMEIMREIRVSPDVTAYNYLLTSHCFTGNLKAAAGLLKEMEAAGMAADTRTYDALVLGACRAGKVEGAMVLLRRMEDEGVGILYSTHAHVINGLLKLGYYAQAVEFVMIYGGKDKKLDEENFGILGSRLIYLKRFEEATVVLKEMRKRGLVMRSHELQDFYELNLTQNF